MIRTIIRYQLLIPGRADLYEGPDLGGSLLITVMAPRFFCYFNDEFHPGVELLP